MKKGRIIIYLLFFLVMLITLTCKKSEKTLIPNANRPLTLHDSLLIVNLLDSGFKQRLTNPDQTIEYANRAMTLSVKTNYKRGIGDSYRIRAFAYHQLNNIHMASEDLTASLQIFRNLKDTVSLARVFINISNIYKGIDPKRSLKFLKHAIKLLKDQPNNAEVMAGAYFNLASLYQVQTDFRLSLKYLNESYAIFQKINDERSMIMYYQNSGMIYYHLKDYEEAIRRTKIALEKSRERDLTITTMGCSLLLGTIFHAQGNLKQAAEVLESGHKLALETKNEKMGMLFNLQMHRLNKSRNKYPSALNNLYQAFRYDSLLLEKNLIKNIEVISTNYVLQQDIQNKNLTIATQKYEQAKFWWIVTGIISLLLLVILGVFSLHYLREKKWQKEQIGVKKEIAVLEQKAILAMMNPHFVFNVMTTVQNHINHSDNTTANSLLSRFSQLVRTHLEICLNSSISLEEELVYLDLYLSLEKSRFGDKMNYQISIDKDLETEDILIPSMLIQPFVENSILHGIMPAESGGLIIISFILDNDYLKVTISDDGIGISNSNKMKNPGHISRGMNLIEDRVFLINKINDRSINIIQKQNPVRGTTVEIILPV